MGHKSTHDLKGVSSQDMIKMALQGIKEAQIHANILMLPIFIFSLSYLCKMHQTDLTIK